MYNKNKFFEMLNNFPVERDGANDADDPNADLVQDLGYEAEIQDSNRVLITHGGSMILTSTIL